MQWHLNPIHFLGRFRRCKTCGHRFFAKAPGQKFCTRAHQTCLSKETKEKVKAREDEITRILIARGRPQQFYDERAIVRDEIRERFK